MRRDKRSQKRWLTIGLFTVMLLPVFTTQCADNIRFHGELVVEPCVIRPGKESVQLDFGMVIDQYLYINRRTHGKPFELDLMACDLGLVSIVRVTFLGKESLHLPGLLAIDAASEASGIAIGMETLAGKPLPLNLVGQKYPLAKGDNLMTLKAYVQGEPQAIVNQNIKRGFFSAVATFSLEYE